MIHESRAREHYLNIRAEREEVRRPMGFQRPRANNVTPRQLYQQPYGIPWQQVTDWED